LTNVPGVLENPSDPESLVLELSRGEAERRIEDGRIAGGMIPKVEAALQALSQGASYAVIADGRGAVGLRAALSSSGTRIRLEEAP
jgi:acetylglutamate kinase